MYISNQNSKNQSARVKPPENYGGTAFRDGDIQSPPAEIKLPPGLLSDDDRPEPQKDPIPGHQLRPNFIREPSPHGGEAHDRNRPPGGQSHNNPPVRDTPGRNSEKTPPPDDKTPPETPREDNRSRPEPACDLPPLASDESRANPEPIKGTPKNPLKSLFSSIMPPGIGDRRDDGRDFGFEELLILGLILLLSQSDGDNDILLILALLFFLQ